MDYSHNNAFGVNIPKNKLNEIIAKCNEMLPLDKLCTIHQCDWEILAPELKKEYVQAVAENYEVWGSTVPEPTFAITNLKINAENIHSYGESGSFIRFVYNGIPFIKKYCQHDEFDKMTCKTRNSIGNKKNLTLNIIGQFKLNAFDDKVLPEVKILFFDSEEDKEKDKGYEPEEVKKNIADVEEVEDIEKDTNQSMKIKKTTLELDDFDW